MVQKSDLDILLGSSSECDITGDSIEKMEIKLRMFDELEISERGLKKLEELDKSKKSVKCNSCFEHKPGIVVREKQKSEKSRFCLCLECRKEAYEKSISMLESLKENLVYKDKSGFAIYNEKVCIFDSVLCRASDPNMFFIISYDDKGGISIKSDISQIEKVSEGLQKPSKADFMERMTLSGDCTVCGKENSKYKIHVSYICGSCASEVGSAMENYLENDPQKIISQII